MKAKRAFGVYWEVRRGLFGFASESRQNGIYRSPAPTGTTDYEPLQIIEQFLVSIWCGANRFAHADITRMDGTLSRLFGWTRVARHKAIMRLFNRFDMARNEQVQG